MLNYVNAEYIDTGVFISEQKDCMDLKFECREKVVVMKKSDFDKIIGFEYMINGESIVVRPTTL